MVKVGEKGQIVIPAKARKLFDIKPGDNLIILGDEGQGIAIIKEKGLVELLGAARKMRPLWAHHLVRYSAFFTRGLRPRGLSTSADSPLSRY